MTSDNDADDDYAAGYAEGYMAALRDVVLSMRDARTVFNDKTSLHEGVRIAFDSFSNQLENVFNLNAAND